MPDDTPRGFAPKVRTSFRYRRKKKRGTWGAVGALLRITLLLSPSAAFCYFWFNGGPEKLLALREGIETRDQADSASRPDALSLESGESPPTEGPLSDGSLSDRPPEQLLQNIPPASPRIPPGELLPQAPVAPRVEPPVVLDPKEQPKLEESADAPVEEEPAPATSFGVNIQRGHQTYVLADSLGRRLFDQVVVSGANGFDGYSYDIVPSSGVVTAGRDVRIKINAPTPTYDRGKKVRAALQALNKSVNVEVLVRGVEAAGVHSRGRISKLRIDSRVTTLGGGHAEFTDRSVDDMAHALWNAYPEDERTKALLTALKRRMQTFFDVLDQLGGAEVMIQAP